LLLFYTFFAIMAMTTHIPEKLKAADLTRFIVRAGQLEKVKPVMAYWCM
jgi:vacuolar protein sorting-associated protein VTA1